MQAFVGLEPVAPVPVAAALDERLSPLDVLLDQLLVAEEEPRSDDGEDEVDLGPEDARLLKNVFVGGDCFLL